MNKSVAFIAALISFALAVPQGQSCGPENYFVSPSFDVTPYPPVKGQTSVLTLSGTTPLDVTLQDWDLYWNFNGRLVQQYDAPLTGTYQAHTVVNVTYNYAVPASSESGYYNLRLLLQNSQGFYINCWQFSYYLVG
ncbi:hypothetical protein SteCoe_29764 [Stentor coeruleus]|uniref:Immunoglobulin subtype domain-containing protein n=1 Tax=Stentor coeruleus TaxID=5963 RepID=A0A1R2B554_9CILI|nr:hypothetical protein SteCoe_29764 [Stentor coeruleus]